MHGGVYFFFEEYLDYLPQKEIYTVSGLSKNLHKQATRKLLMRLYAKLQKEPCFQLEMPELSKCKWIPWSMKYLGPTKYIDQMTPEQFLSSGEEYVGLGMDCYSRPYLSIYDAETFGVITIFQRTRFFKTLWAWGTCSVFSCPVFHCDYFDEGWDILQSTLDLAALGYKNECDSLVLPTIFSVAASTGKYSSRGNLHSSRGNLRWLRSDVVRR